MRTKKTLPERAKKLALHSETLRLLERGDLQQVVAGASLVSVCYATQPKPLCE